MTCTDVEFLFAQAESCSTQISRQWTFPSAVAYFDLKYVKSEPKTVRGCDVKGQIQAVGLC